MQEKEWFRQEKKGEFPPGISAVENPSLERDATRQGRTQKKSMRDKERMIRFIKSLRKERKNK